MKAWSGELHRTPQADTVGAPQCLTSVLKLSISLTMDSAKLLDTISSLELLTESIPDQLREDEKLRKRLFDVVQKLVPEIETPAETSQRLLYAVSPSSVLSSLKSKLQ